MYFSIQYVHGNLTLCRLTFSNKFEKSISEKSNDSTIFLTNSANLNTFADFFPS